MAVAALVIRFVILIPVGAVLFRSLPGAPRPIIAVGRYRSLPMESGIIDIDILPGVGDTRQPGMLASPAADLMSHTTGRSLR